MKYKNKISFCLMALLLGFFTISQNARAKLADSPWPMFHGSAQHGGLSPYNTSHINGTVKWTFETGAGIESSPVVGTDGTIYFGSHDGYLYAISRNGELKWKIKIGTAIIRSFSGRKREMEISNGCCL